MMRESELRPTFTVGRVAEGGRLSFARTVAFAEALLGRPLTAEERARQLARWRQRFPDTPTGPEPPAR
jgi:hypothetical protein